jgi:peptide subunit release factor 1 (eRF1)
MARASGAGAHGTLDALREDAEERLRSIEQLTRKRIKRPAKEAPRLARSLAEAQQDGRGITRRELREMAHPYGIAVITLYVSLAPTDPGGPKPLLTLWHSMRHTEQEQRNDVIAALPRDAREQLDLDLAEIESFLRDDLDVEGARGFVLFKAGAALNRVMALPVPVPNRMSIDVDPYVAPLDAVLSAQRRALLALVEKDQARFWVDWAGKQDEVTDIESFVPTDNVDKARPGKVQRHRLTHRHWHMRSVAQTIREVVEERECEAIILSGDDPELTEITGMLPKALRDMVIGTFPIVPRMTEREREDRVQAILARRRAEEEAESIADLGFFAGHGMLFAGLPDVVAIADNFFVRTLFVVDDLVRPGAVCREHHYVSLDESECPWDGRPLLPTENVVDELLEMAWLYGVEVIVVRERRDLLEPYQGIAAVTFPTET